jgi:sirohydrochlorin ferrochelatase
MNPEQLRTRDALAEGAITHKNQDDLVSYQLTNLSHQILQCNLNTARALGKARLGQVVVVPVFFSS